jgi:hypothetical protein
VPDVTVFMTFLVPQTPLHRHLAEHRADRLAQGFGAVEHEQHPLLGIQPALDQIRQQRGRDGRVLGAPSHSPSGIFLPSVVIPRATIIIRPFSSRPSSIITANRRSGSCRAISSESACQVALNERSGHRPLRRRPRPDLDLFADRFLRATVPERGHAGEHPLQDDPAKGIPVSEMLIRPSCTSDSPSAVRTRNRCTSTRRPPSVTSPSS